MTDSDALTAFFRLHQTLTRLVFINVKCKKSYITRFLPSNMFLHICLCAVHFLHIACPDYSLLCYLPQASSFSGRWKLSEGIISSSPPLTWRRMLARQAACSGDSGLWHHVNQGICLCSGNVKERFFFLRGTGAEAVTELFFHRAQHRSNWLHRCCAAVEINLSLCSFFSLCVFGQCL